MSILELLSLLVSTVFRCLAWSMLLLLISITWP